jgi:hypothetical protein
MSDWKDVLLDLKKNMRDAKGSGVRSKDDRKIQLSQPATMQAHKRQISGPHVQLKKTVAMPGGVIKHIGQPIRPHLRAPEGVPQKSVTPKIVVNHTVAPTVRRSLAKTLPSLPPVQRGVPASFQTKIRNLLTRQACFKIPEKWVSAGTHTQFATQQLKQSKVIDVFIGLDFGTSYTKAAVGLKDQVFVVSWEGIFAGQDMYLLPSEFSIMGEGSCQIGQSPDVSAEHVRQRLKQPLIDTAVSSASLGDAAVFVALVLHYIRAWVFFHHGDKIGASAIRWMLNIGAPSNGLENERHKLAYTKLGHTAWAMSLSEIEMRPGRAVELIRAWQPAPMPQDLIAFDVLPEFVAQIAGYVQSAQRQRGLHALVDVGGGTLDVVTFIVHDRDGEDVFPFLVPEIKVLGTQMLNQNRIVEASGYEETRLPDELQPVLDSYEYAKITGLPKSHIELRDKIFWTEVHRTIYRVFEKTKRSRYRLSDAWTKGLPVFLTGGGGTVEGYRHSVGSGGKHFAPTMNLMSLPMHRKLVEFQGDISDYQRVSVACGLAQDSFSLGQLIPAGLVEDDKPVTARASDRPDRDELYAR